MVMRVGWHSQYPIVTFPEAWRKLCQSHGFAGLLYSFGLFSVGPVGEVRRCDSLRRTALWKRGLPLPLLASQRKQLHFLLNRCSEAFFRTGKGRLALQE